jgi:hypothetical protein
MREICQSGFDEREEETELRQTGLRRRGESPATCHRKATVTAPLLDSTRRISDNVGGCQVLSCPHHSLHSMKSAISLSLMFSLRQP